MFLLNLIIVMCLGIGITLAIMWVVSMFANTIAWETTIFDGLCSDPNEAQVRIAWIMTSVLLGFLIAWILL